MIQYVEKLGTEYLKGEKCKGASRRRYSDYRGAHVVAMSCGGFRLYSCDTVIALVNRADKVLYINGGKYSRTTTEQQKSLREVADRLGFRVVEREGVAATYRAFEENH